MIILYLVPLSRISLPPFLHTLLLTAPPIQVVHCDIQYNEIVITGIDDESMMTL